MHQGNIILENIIIKIKYRGDIIERKSFKEEYPFNLLTQYIIDSYNIEKDTKYSVFDIDARELIISSRIDLIAKLIYIDFKVKKIDSNFGKEIYIKHIEAFTNGTYTEPGNPQKNSIDKYIKQFDNLIDKIKTNGFNSNISLIPIGKNFGILDGAHRLSCAAYFNKKVRVIQFHNISTKFDYEFFKSRLLDGIYLDFMINEYCKIKKDIYIACVWPIVNFEKYKLDINNIIEKNSNIVCLKEIDISHNGLKHLMIQIYKNESWIATYKDKFEGVVSKVDRCYNKNGKIRVYILESTNLKSVLKMKQDVRKLIGIQENSIHTTDNQAESIQVAQLLFNENSLNHLNVANPYKYYNFNKILEIYKKNIIDNNFNLNDFITDSSMSIYGIRESNDICFFSKESKQSLIENEFIQNNDSQLSYYNLSKDSIVYDPRNYFVCNDLKFVTLDLLKQMKNNRKENKDKKDINLIDKFLRNKRIRYFNKISEYIYGIKRTKRNCKFYIKRKLRNIKILKLMYSYIKKVRIRKNSKIN